MTIKHCKLRRNESLMRFVGTAGVPPAMSAKRENLTQKDCARGGAFEGGTQAVPASRLTATLNGKRVKTKAAPASRLCSCDRISWRFLILYSHLPKHVSVVKRNLVQIVVPAGRTAVTGAHVYL
jgi:hypothetical protein